jgi:hypothetical protein
MGKDTVARTDVINPEDPIIELIEMHERQCSYQAVEDLSAEPSKAALATLAKLIRRDLAIRFYAVSELGLKREHELFIFGRPLFKVLETRGITVRLPADSLRLPISITIPPDTR